MLRRFDSDATEQANAWLEVRLLARTVQNRRQFLKIMRQVVPDLRERVYGEISPHLKFTPLTWPQMALLLGPVKPVKQPTVTP